MAPLNIHIISFDDLELYYICMGIYFLKLNNIPQIPYHHPFTEDEVNVMHIFSAGVMEEYNKKEFK